MNVILKDGSHLVVEANKSYADIALQLSPSLRKKIAGVKVNGALKDLTLPAQEGDAIEFFTFADAREVFPLLNHSTAHLMAQAMLRLFPGIQFTIGPAIEDGYYYDFKAPVAIVNEDLPKIEAEMLKVAKENHKIVRREVSKAEALAHFASNPFKVELINDLQDGKITFYQQGEFTDLCVGPHVEHTGLIKHFKLLQIAGAYWRGDAKRDSLQRIYGVSLPSEEALKAHLLMLEERKDRDHRKIGKAQEIFMFSNLIGQGLPVWLPNGFKVKKVLQDYIMKLEVKYGYEHVYTPVLGSVDLYRTSGHWNHYRENMFPPMQVDNEELVLRPMACPHHCQVYNSKLRSYRDLPLRIAEHAVMYRYEASGALTGLERVRAMDLTDSHTFARPDQVKSEFAHALKLILQVIKDLKVEISYNRLSLRDPADKEKYYPNDAMWNNAESMLRQALDESGIHYEAAIGEAAFYGPKLDIQIKTALGHDITVSTIQLDFLLPEKFDLSFIAPDGSKARPVMIHRGLIGTYERFTAVLLEQYKGVFPTWLAPIQVNILPVLPDLHGPYAQEVFDALVDAEIRVKRDIREEKLGYRLRDSQMDKIPYSLVIGDQEMADRTVTYRPYNSKEQVTVKLADFIAMIRQIVVSKQ